MHGQRSRQLGALLVALVLGVALVACGSDRSAEVGDAPSPGAAAPGALPAAPDVATSVVAGVTTSRAGAAGVPASPTTRASTPTAAGALPTPPPTAAPATPGGGPAPAAAPPSTKAPLSPEMVRWCPVAGQAWLLLSNISALKVEDVPKALEVVTRTRDLAPAEVRPQMDRLMELAQVIQKGVDEGKINLAQPGGATAYIDDQLGAGATARYTEDLKAVANFGFANC